MSWRTQMCGVVEAGNRSCFPPEASAITGGG
jgi:hypothetical protein